MATTERFYVGTKDNKVRPVTTNPNRYFDSECKEFGKAKYIVEVFSIWNHKEEAKKVRDIIDEKELSNSIYRIRIETK